MSGIDVYKIVNKKPVLVGYIKSDEEIDRETLAEIREKYSLEDELKVLRLASADPESFKAYNDYVEECRAKGKQKKLDAASKLKALKKKKITENGESRTIYVEAAT